MPETISTEPPKHQSGGLAVALAKLNLDALTVSDAVADVASMAGENVTTTIRADFRGLQADFKELRADMHSQIGEVNARIDTLTSELNGRIGTLTSETNGRFAETNARIDTLAGAVQSLQREISTLRWMIGIGFTSLSVLVGLATLFLRFGSGS